MLFDFTHNKNAKGIGGWLILVAISIILSFPILLFQLVSYYLKLFPNGDFTILFDEISYFFSCFIVVEVMFNIIILFAYSYLIYLFFTKNYKTPKVFIVTKLGNLIFIIVDKLFVSIIFNVPVFDSLFLKDITPQIIGCCIWIPYFLSSVRVKNTFIVGKPNYSVITANSSIIS